MIIAVYAERFCRYAHHLSAVDVLTENDESATEVGPVIEHLHAENDHGHRHDQRERLRREVERADIHRILGLKASGKGWGSPWKGRTASCSRIKLAPRPVRIQAYVDLADERIERK